MTRQKWCIVQLVALIIAQNGEFSCIAYLKDEGFLSIDNNGYPIFIIYGNVRIDNSPGDSYRVAVPLHYRNRKVWQFCCFTGKENIQKAHAAADGAEKVIFTAAGREKITLKNGDTAYRYKGYTMFPVGGSELNDPPKMVHRSTDRFDFSV